MRSKIPYDSTYQAELTIWETALASKTNTVRLPCESRSRAITMVHRLNRARAAARNASGLDAHPYDTMVSKLEHNEDNDRWYATIAPRSYIDLSILEDEDGNPVQPATDYVPNRAGIIKEKLLDERALKEFQNPKMTPESPEFKEFVRNTQGLTTSPTPESLDKMLRERANAGKFPMNLETKDGK